MNMKQRQTCCNPNLREPPAYLSIIVNAMEAVANTNGMTNRGNKFVVSLLVAKKNVG